MPRRLGHVAVCSITCCIALLSLLPWLAWLRCMHGPSSPSSSLLRTCPSIQTVHQFCELTCCCAPFHPVLQRERFWAYVSTHSNGWAAIVLVSSVNAVCYNMVRLWPVRHSGIML